MLINTKFDLFVRCPNCGRGSAHDLSLFDLSKGRTISLPCPCGLTTARVRKYRGTITFLVACLICERFHFLSMPMRDLCSGKAVNLYCPLTGAPLALGTESSLDPIIDEALLILDDLALRGGILCQCGHGEMDVEPYPDRLELVCKSCGGRLTIPTADEKDLADLARVERIMVDQQRLFPKE
jgi:hypothetical protein